jgi:uncharacterized protein (TIGR02246 family)
MVIERGLIAIGALGLSLAAPGLAQDYAAQEQLIRAAARDYQAALAQGDPQTIAQFWTANGTFTDELGTPRPASELFAEAARSTGAGDPKKSGDVTSTIRFITPDVALEDGASEVEGPGAALSRGHFHATWVKQDGRWRLASLCEVPVTSAAPKLAELGWMVGNWSAREGDIDLQVSLRWNATGTYLLRDLKAMHQGNAVFRSTQRIGIDPRTGKLASWTFDSDGGLGEATWTKQGEIWIAQSTGVLPDGRQTSGTNVITQDGANSLVWKTVAASVEGQAVDDHEIRFTRESDVQK